MKNLHLLVVITIVFCTLVFILTLGDFLALHDIKQDYVSQEILGQLEVSVSGKIPEWTGTPGEWSMVRVSYLARFAFLILSWITLVLCASALRTRPNKHA